MALTWRGMVLFAMLQIWNARLIREYYFSQLWCVKINFDVKLGKKYIFSTRIFLKIRMPDLTQLVHTCAACWVGKKKTENTLCDAVLHVIFFVCVQKKFRYKIGKKYFH